MSSENTKILKTLKGIQTLLTDLNKKMDKLVGALESAATRPASAITGLFSSSEDEKPTIETKDDMLRDIIALTTSELASLPEYLQITALAIDELLTATSLQVSEKTQKERGIESTYLNQLYKRGNVNKFRIGRRVFFSIQPKCNIQTILQLPRVAQEPAVILLRESNPISKMEIADKLMNEFEISKKKTNSITNKALKIFEEHNLLETTIESDTKENLYSLTFPPAETEG